MSASKLGLMISNEHIALREGAEIGRLAEAAGFESLWMSDFWRSYSVQLAAVAETTKRARLGPHTAMGFSRSPYIGARVAADLDELCGGRLVLGLGSGTLDPGREDGWVRERVRPQVEGFREMVNVMRYAWKTWYEAPGKALNYESDECALVVPPFYSSRKTLRPEIPIYLGARRRSLLELAGEIADGFIMMPATSARYTREEVIPSFEKGAARVGRDLSSFTLVGVYVCAVSDDRGRALQRARQQLSWFAGDQIFKKLFERDGFGEEAARIRAAMRAHDFAGMEAAMSEEMVQALGFAGTQREFEAWLEKTSQLVDVVILEVPSWRCSEAEILANHRAVIDAVAKL